METAKAQNADNEIVFYQSDELLNLDVRIESDTLWLSQKQMAALYGTEIPAISKHIKNIYFSNELEEASTLSKMETVQNEGGRNIHRRTSMYNLDMIIAVGYRVNSHKATQFRIWATKVLKEYLLRGYAISQRVDRIENQVFALNNQLQSLLHSSLPPKQGVFFEGQIFDAYQFVADLVRSANASIVLIDNYVNDSVLTLLDKRAENVTATIGVNKISPGVQLDLQRHNAQYPPVDIREIAAVHDRFLLLDGERLYTFGASFKDLGKKLFCFSLMESDEVIRMIIKLLNHSGVEQAIVSSRIVSQKTVPSQSEFHHSLKLKTHGNCKSSKC